MELEKLEKVFESVRTSHGNAKPLKFETVACDASDLDGSRIKEPCIECVSHRPNKSGYPQLRVGKEMHRFHRLAWTLVNGPIPDGHEIDHRCRNKACVNPDHLQALPEESHKYKTSIERMLFEDHEKREAVIVYMQTVDKPSDNEIAELFGIGRSTVKKYWKELRLRTDHFRRLSS